MFYFVFAQRKKNTSKVFICQEIVQNLENEHTEPVVLFDKPRGCEFLSSDARGAVSPGDQMVNAYPEADPTGISFSDVFQGLSSHGNFLL